MNKFFDLKSGSRNIVDLKTPHHFTKQSGVGFQPALRRAQPKRSGSKRFFTALLVLLFLIISATAAGFFIFYNNGSSNDSVKLSLSTPKNLSSGEELTLALAYENLDKVLLKDIEVVAQYPQGFFFDRANLEPSGTEKNIWQLPDLAVGQKGKIEVVGQLIGKINEAKEFNLIFYYQPANFNSTFKTELKTKVTISDVLFEVKAESPKELLPGTEANFKVSYKNATAAAMPDMSLGFDLGDNFNLTEASPITTSDLIWLFPKIEGGEQGEINFKGKFKETVNGDVPWQFRVVEKVVREGQKQERLLYQEEGTIKIVAPAVKIDLQPEKSELNLGDALVYHLALENTGQTKITDAVLQLKVDSALVDWQNFTQTQGETVKDNTLSWTKDSGDFGKKLAAIQPGAKEELSISLPLVKEPSTLNNPEEFNIIGQASLNYNFAGQTLTVSSQPAIASLLAKPKLTVEARYYLDSKTKVGQGPLPPTIGQQTQYRIYWKVFAGSKGLSQGEVKASLPPYLKWLKQIDQTTSGNAVNYNEADRQLSWRWDSLPAFSETMVSFDLAVTPTESQVNQLLILTNPTALASHEQGTDAVVSKTANLLTSDLVGDPLAQGKGRVVVGK